MEELTRIEESLQINRDFVAEVLQAKPLGLLFLSEAALATFHDLVIKRLPDISACDCANSCATELASRLGPPVLQCPGFKRVWFCAGGPFVHEYYDKVLFPEPWTDQEDVFLWIAEHSWDPSKHFKHAAQRLKGDVAFMIKATALRSVLYEFAVDDIKKKNELVVMHISNNRLAQWYIAQDDTFEWKAWTRRLYSRLWEDARNYHKFNELFLPEPSNTATGRSQSLVRRLRQDPRPP